MTGNPQLTERQETLLRKADRCRELANNLRAWKGHYNQNCTQDCVMPHMHRMNVDKGVLGIGNLWDLIGFTKDYNGGAYIHKCAHDGTPTGAAEWLEQHALTLEAQV